MVPVETVSKQPSSASRSAPERAREILRLLEQRRRVSVEELSEVLGVSQVTVRHDLEALSQQHLVVRVRGAAVAASETEGELDFGVRLYNQRHEKQAIARAAAERVDDGEVVALDASTTAYYLALELKRRRELVIVTNSLRVASALLDAPQITVVLTGGQVRRAAQSLVGELGKAVLAQIHIGKGFFSGSGLSLEDGLLDIHPEEVHLKRAMVAACREPVAIVDHTKLGRSGLLSFARPNQLVAMITDDQAPEDAVRAWRKVGVTVDNAPSQGEARRHRAMRREK